MTHFCPRCTCPSCLNESCSTETDNAAENHGHSTNVNTDNAAENHSHSTNVNTDDAAVRNRSTAAVNHMQLLEMYNALTWAIVVGILTYIVCNGIWGYTLFIYEMRDHEKTQAYQMREQHFVRVIHNQRREHHEETQAYQWLHQKMVNLEVRIADLGSENDNLRMEVEHSNEMRVQQTADRVRVIRRQRRKLDKERQTSHQEKVNLEMQKADLGLENNNLRMELDNVTDTLQMVKWLLNAQAEQQTRELQKIHTELAKQLELVYHDNKMSIEERDEHVRLLELELKHKNGEIVDLQINLRQTLKELEESKSSAETWSMAAKFAGGAAILLGTSVLAPYALPYVGAALKVAAI